eukprot:TRINITY_DN8741_c0_g1_i2.p1 TRINITY_DN8741_c0_g1~~TRINITY_DN8741_c0_g1_i2.p1  ORF type:complete len:693 (+),score=216.94 TRINITY_DN8741_c0_g1_i2:85-2079(+)
MSDEDHVGCVTVRPSEIRGKGSPTVHFDTCSRVQERKPGADFLPAHCDNKCKGRFVIKIMEVQPKDKKCRYGSCKGTVDSGETTHYVCVECRKITCTNCVNQSQAKLRVLNIPDWLHGKPLDDLLECIKKQLCARRYISLKRMVCKNAAFLTFLDSAGSPCGLPIGTKSIEFDVSVEGCIEDTRIKVATWQNDKENDKENDKCRRTDREIYVSVCPGKVSTAGMREQRAAFVSLFPRGAEEGKSCLVPSNVCMAAVLIEIGKCWLERREQNHSREFLGIKGPADLFEYFVPNVAFPKSEMGRSGEKQGGAGRRGKPADKSKEEQDFNNCRVKFFAELTKAGTRVVREVFADPEKDADFINGFLSVQHLETDDRLPIACVVQLRQEKGNEGEGKMASSNKTADKASPGDLKFLLDKAQDGTRMWHMDQLFERKYKNGSPAGAGRGNNSAGFSMKGPPIHPVQQQPGVVSTRDGSTTYQSLPSTPLQSADGNSTCGATPTTHGATVSDSGSHGSDGERAAGQGPPPQDYGPQVYGPQDHHWQGSPGSSSASSAHGQPPPVECAQHGEEPQQYPQCQPWQQYPQYPQYPQDQQYQQYQQYMQYMQYQQHQHQQYSQRQDDQQHQHDQQYPQTVTGVYMYNPYCLAGIQFVDDRSCPPIGGSRVPPPQ